MVECGMQEVTSGHEVRFPYAFFWRHLPALVFIRLFLLEFEYVNKFVVTIRALVDLMEIVRLSAVSQSPPNDQDSILLCSVSLVPLRIPT